ncbi:MAG: patatin-like phospholipase family protein [Bacteroidota bacterium]
MTARALRLLIVFAVAISSHPPPAGAEEALVLSGGGSRGLAHAGVVLGLEARGHDPGLLVCTSMGSIVGGLYASGYDGRAIRSLLEHEDWRAIFTPFPFEVGASRALRYPVLRFDTVTGAAFGSRAYIPDWRINRRLTQLLFDASARARGDFDRLPRRFRSVTADGETGELIPLASGDLPRAVRASMAAAGFFAPVRWRAPGMGSRLLTDGGIADYLPVAEARRLGGAPVIASDVMKPPPRLESLDALSVARRSEELLAVHARLEKAAPDVLILPQVDVSLPEFSYPVDPGPVIDAGLRTTLETLPESTAATPPQKRAPLPEPESLAALVVEDAGIPETQDLRLLPFVRRAFREEAPGRFRPERVLAIVDRLYATGLFDGVWPSVEGATDAAGRAGGDAAGAGVDTASAAAPTLYVRAEARAPVSVSGALGYDNDRGGRIWGSLRRLDAAGEVPYDIALEGSANGVEEWGSASVRAATLLFGASAWTAGARFGETEVRFLQAPGTSGDLAVRRAGGWAGFETLRLDPAWHVAAGIRAERVDSDFGPDGSAYGPYLRVEGIPPLVRVAGTAPLLEAEARFGGVPYRRARARGSVGAPLGPLVLAATGDVAAVGGEAPLDAAPSMGGEGLVPGLREGERRGRARAIAGVDLTTAAAFNATLRLRARGGVVADEVRTDGGDLYSREKLWLGGVRFSALWWTPFGPVEVGAEGSTLGDRRVVVFLGPDF